MGLFLVFLKLFLFFIKTSHLVASPLDVHEIPSPPVRPIPPIVVPPRSPPTPPPDLKPPSVPIPPPEIPPKVPRDQGQGKNIGQLAYERECAVCHGPSGEGTERGYPIKRPYRPYATEVTRKGRESQEFPIPMPAYPQSLLSDLELAEIWTFLDGSTVGDDLALGADLYRWFCSNCHGKDGKGGFSRQDIRPAAGSEVREGFFSDWIRWGSHHGDYMNRSAYMPRWNQWEISDNSIEKIKKYLQSLGN